MICDSRLPRRNLGSHLWQSCCFSRLSRLAWLLAFLLLLSSSDVENNTLTSHHSRLWPRTRLCCSLVTCLTPFSLSLLRFSASPLLGFSASQLARLQQATVRRSRQLLGCLSLWLSASEMDGRCCLADRSNQREATRRIGGRGTNQSHVACIAPCPWMYSMCR